MAPRITAIVGVVACLSGRGAAAATPMSYLRTFGPSADPVTRLGWGLLAISIAVMVIITVLVLWAYFRRRPATPRDPSGLPAVARSGSGLSWLYIGVGLSIVVLFASAVWMMVVLAAVARPTGDSPFTLRITGHQWWWEARYTDPKTGESFVTANEIHIPVGYPVRIDLVSADVIHSFWVPALAGKTDTIPGQTNIAWLEASQAGVYRGQCTEYCGRQHAHMGLSVVADEPAAFDTWWRGQMRPADEPALAQATDGKALFGKLCGSCHEVRGTPAKGQIGPDLTHLMSRNTIGALALPNSIGNLGGWVADAQSIKPGCYMPTMASNLSGPELRAVLAYLTSLE